MQTIADIAFFRGITDLDLARFERRCLWKKADEGQTIVDFDDLSSDVHFLVSGDVRIQMRTPGGKEFILADLGAGEFFGELSAIDGEPRSAHVSALTRAVIGIISASLFREMLATSPMMSNKVMQLLARRIRELNARLLEHAVLDIRHNLYAELLRLSIPRLQAPPARIVTPPPYHHVLAARSAAGASRSRGNCGRWRRMACCRRREAGSSCPIPRPSGSGSARGCARRADGLHCNARQQPLGVPRSRDDRTTMPEGLCQRCALAHVAQGRQPHAPRGGAVERRTTSSIGSVTEPVSTAPRMSRTMRPAASAPIPVVGM